MKKLFILLLTFILLLCSFGLVACSECKHESESQRTIIMANCSQDGLKQVTCDSCHVVTRTIKITATGDCTFATDINASRDLGFVAYQERYGNDWFFKNVKSIFEDDDLTIVNFEGTLSDRGERAIKQFAFRGKPEYAKILSGSSVEAANLANNHSMDFSHEGLMATKKAVKMTALRTYQVWNGLF